MSWKHKIVKIERFEKIAPFTLCITFDDAIEKIIDFRPVLKGTIFGALNDEKVFDTVHLDSEIHTLVWENGADFDPATLHDWSDVYQLPEPDVMKAAEAKESYGSKES